MLLTSILIISACSFDRNHLKTYGYTKDTTPNLTRFAEDAFVFDNYVVHKSWANFEGTLKATWFKPEDAARFDHFKKEIFQEIHVPEPVMILRPRYVSNYDSADWKKSQLENELEPKKARILNSDDPFFLFMHFKSAHYPYMGANADEIPYARFMSPRSLELARSYSAGLEDPAKSNYAKTPLVVLLFNNLDFVSRAVKHERKTLGLGGPWEVTDPDGILGNDRFLAAWRKTPTYSDDLRLLNEAYDSKLFYTDNELAGLISLYQDPKTQSRTATIFVGDHGTELMEHGYLHNGTTPYDELIRIPLLIRLPGVKGTHRISAQLSEDSLARLVRDIASGEITSKNLETRIARYEDPVILSRDCANTSVSLRFKNQWKYIQNIASGHDELYDLATDPRETSNLVESQQKAAGKLQEMLLDHQEEIATLRKEPCPDNNVPRKFQ